MNEFRQIMEPSADARMMVKTIRDMFQAFIDVGFSTEETWAYIYHVIEMGHKYREGT